VTFDVKTQNYQPSNNPAQLNQNDESSESLEERTMYEMVQRSSNSRIGMSKT